jgi:aminoglycoside 3-N-acetyltransferase
MSLLSQLRDLGVRRGDALVVHSSFKSLGIKDPEEIIVALQEALGDRGTLLMPALSYAQVPPERHDTRLTPSCVGFLTEYFRGRPGTRRSLHPTHSVCAAGHDVGGWLDGHAVDTTPCGPHSPFRLLRERGGRILMLGCGLSPNTTMHAVEELVRPAYLFGKPLAYTIIGVDRKPVTKVYTPHGFEGVTQRYERIEKLMKRGSLCKGPVGKATAHLVDAAALFEAALAAMKRDPECFVERSAVPGKA